MSNNPLIVVVDDGFAYTKVAYYNDASELVTHSIASRGAYATSPMLDSNDQCINTYMVKKPDDTGHGQMFVVNKNVQNPMDTRFDEYPYSPLNSAIIHHALHQAGVPEDRPIELVVTLPPRVMYSPAKKAAIDKRANMLMNGQVTRLLDIDSSDFQGTSYTIADVKVVSEAVVAQFDYYLDDACKPQRQRNGSMVIVDIGGRTTDIAYIMLDDNNRPVVDHNRTGTEELGVLSILEALHHEVNAVLARNEQPQMTDVNFTLMEKALGNGMFWQHNVSDACERSIRSVSERVYHAVQKRIGNAYDVDAIMFIGGGADIMRKALSQYQQVFIPETPQFTNALGGLKLSTLRQRTQAPAASTTQVAPQTSTPDTAEA
jgi:plasmid segregation protein ParM